MEDILYENCKLIFETGKLWLTHVRSWVVGALCPLAQGCAQQLSHHAGPAVPECGCSGFAVYCDRLCCVCWCVVL